MWIKTERNNLVRLSIPEMEGVAEFSDNNVAQVTESDGALLIEEYDHISEHTTED
jgi:hypothetical protein